MNSSVVPAGRSSTSSLRSSLYDTVYRSSPMLLPRSSLSPAGAGACFSFLAPNSCARSARPALAPLFDTRIHRGVRVPPGRMHGAQTHAGSKGARGQEGERGGGNERASEQRTARASTPSKTHVPEPGHLTRQLQAPTRGGTYLWGGVAREATVGPAVPRTATTATAQRPRCPKPRRRPREQLAGANGCHRLPQTEAARTGVARVRPAASASPLRPQTHLPPA